MIQALLNANIRPCVALSSGQGQQETSCKAAHPQTHFCHIRAQETLTIIDVY